MADFTQAIKLDAKYAFAWNNRAAAQLKLEEYARAEADASEAIKLNADYAEAYFNRGHAREMLRKADEACADWRKAASLGIGTGNDYAAAAGCEGAAAEVPEK